MKRKRRLSDEEARLWALIASEATPLRQRDDPPADDLSPPAALPQPAEPRDPALEFLRSVRPTPRSDPPAARVIRSGPLIQETGGNTPGLDRRTGVKLKKGALEPQARLDLHGMTLERAYAALSSFLARETARGSRMVLVVTGKGGDYDRRARNAVQNGAAERFIMPEGRGALREVAPRWLKTDALARYVTGVYAAHAKHGGAGALYVYLRRSR